MHYVALVGNVNSEAYSRLNTDYNFAGYPSIFFDGGSFVRVGGTTDTSFYTAGILNTFHNAVDDIFLEVSLEWMGNTELRVDLKVASNDLTNEPPEVPSTPQGPTELNVGDEATYVTSTTDVDGDEIWYQWCVGALCLDWYGPYSPGDTCQLTRTFNAAGDVEIHVKAKDSWEQSADSDPITVTVNDFICGDANADQLANITDAVYLIDYVFNQGPEPQPLEAGDTNCDDLANVTDAVYLIDYVFNQGPAPCANCN